MKHVLIYYSSREILKMFKTFCIHISKSRIETSEIFYILIKLINIVFLLINEYN